MLLVNTLLGCAETSWEKGVLVSQKIKRSFDLFI